MEISETTAKALLTATKARSVYDVDRSLYKTLVRGLASVTDHEALTPDTPGFSWAGVGGDLNSILIQTGRIVLARVDGKEIWAAAYSSPVGTVEALKLQELADWGTYDFRVGEWCVTLLDGTVFTLRAGSEGNHSGDLTDFVRSYLLP